MDEPALRVGASAVSSLTVWPARSASTIGASASQKLDLAEVVDELGRERDPPAEQADVGGEPRGRDVGARAEVEHAAHVERAARHDRQPNLVVDDVARAVERERPRGAQRD